MAVNKVEINGEMKLDLTGDTVTPETLLSGATAHNAAGVQITGSAEPGAKRFLVTLTTPDYDGGYYDEDVTADKRFAEILAAYQNGEIVQAKWNGWILDLVNIGSDYAQFAASAGGADEQTDLHTVMAYCAGDIADYWEIGDWTNTIPKASTIAPKAPGTAAAGTSIEFARGDHVHPSDDTKQAKINVLGIFKGYGNGSVVRASPGTDYISPANLDTRLHRTTNVHAADTNYTTLMARGESLNAAEVTPAVNGAIAWVYA